MCVRCVRLPLQQGCGGFAESPAHRGEFVTDVRRHDVADGPCEDPVALQVAQGDGEHTLADPVDGPLELGEAARPPAEVTHDQQRPLAADDPEYFTLPGTGPAVVPAATRRTLCRSWLPPENRGTAMCLIDRGAAGAAR